MSTATADPAAAAAPAGGSAAAPAGGAGAGAGSGAAAPANPAPAGQGEAAKAPAQGGEAAKPAADAGKAAEPVKYDLKLADPDKAFFAAEDVAELTKWATDQKIAPEMAQKILEREDALAREIVSDFHAGLAEQHKAERAKWVEAAKADKEYGGEKFAASAEASRRYAEKVGGKELLAFLDSTGLGDHPLLFKAFARAGLDAADDSALTAARGGASDSTASLGSVLYGKPKS